MALEEEFGTLTANKNFLSPLGFRFTLARAPSLEYFCQQASIPSISMGEAQQFTVHTTIPHPGDKITYEPLTLQFSVDEDMANYLELYNWIVGLGHPQDFSQYKELYETNESIFSDGSLVVLTSNNNGNFRIAFQNMFPLSLSTLTFDVTQSDVEYLTADVTFRYRLFTIEKLES
jgi:hypothetical protein